MRYQIGGSLRSNDPTYISRSADRQFYAALKAGKFCYVLNARQMGKTSLLQRTNDRFQQEGCACVSLNMVQLASETATPLQWYRGVMTVLFYGLNLARSVNLHHWWQQQNHLSPPQQLHQFVEDLLLPHVQNCHIFIFIDEIDSLLSLRFPVREFFDWIQDCYQQRAHNSDFNRLNFALAGVTTLAALQLDRHSNLFHLGAAIELHDFQLHEVTPLLSGLEPYVSHPVAILQEIFYWTNGQPFLTQKLCQLVLQATEATPPKKLNLPPGTEVLWIEHLVRSCVIQHWETQDTPEHLRTIRDRLLFSRLLFSQQLFSQHCPQLLLKLYQQILAAEIPASTAPLVPVNNAPEQTELLLAGLVEARKGYLRIKNPIYRGVFNANWVRTQLANLCPASPSLQETERHSVALDHADRPLCQQGV